MQNPEAGNIQDSTINVPPRAQNETNEQNQPQLDSTDESPQSHSSQDATNARPAHDQDGNDAPPPPQTCAPTSPPPPPNQSQMIPSPPPPFLHPMPMLPHPHFQFSPYLNYQPFPPYGYPMIFPSVPGPNMCNAKRSWSTGLFDCFSDIKNCFITTCCPCVTFGQVSEILNEGRTPWWEGAMSYILMEMSTLSTGTFLCAWTYRVKMRKKHQLKGSLFRDLLVSCFCTRLALCQLYRQLDRLGYDVPLGWIANKEKQCNRAMDNRFQVAPPLVEPGMFR